MAQQKPLQILNASAGSGKTYNLVLTYLKMILGEHQYPANFSKIMAMTFTNKAAHEMKVRIIAALDQLSYPDRGNEIDTLKANNYLQDVAKIVGINPLVLQHKAKMALKLILHQYEDFHVMTIDKFNLRLIRSFSLDLNLENDFKVVLKEEEILDNVIDQLLDEISKTENQHLTTLILQYSKEKLENGEKWNFEKDLKQFAQILTKENYNELLKDLNQSEYSIENIRLLKTENRQLKNEITDHAKALHENFQRYNVNDLPGKSTTGNAFNKLITESIYKSETGGFFTAAMLANFEKENFPTELAEASLAFETIYRKLIVTFAFNDLVIKNYYNMLLLKYISERLDEVRISEQVIRISEFNKMISELIKDEEAPFIYERLGNRFQHFLLDEFQDTSRLQWMNIVPLVHESLSKNNANLIVGDPKQSIYRFKNGLAEQFVELPGIYNPDNDAEIERKSQFFKAQGEKIPLDDNWRSTQEIVQFNNHFFQQIAGQLSLTEFYKDVQQHPKGKTGGLIHISVNNQVEETLYETLTFIENAIDQCLEDGFAKGAICLLGYSKNECNQWAIHLTQLGHKVVSADSLIVNSDKAVRLTIAYLKWRKNPAGELEGKYFTELYFSLKTENSIAEIQRYWKQKQVGEKTYNYFDHQQFIIDHFVSEDAFFSAYESLYSLVNQFFSIANLLEIHNPYLHHLADLIFDFDQQRGPDLELFLDYYDSDGQFSAIQTPENDDAIKIMTGHKSKGLEFPIVILPTMDWTILSSKAKHLLKKDDKFIYQLLSEKSLIDVIQEKHQSELYQSVLDKLNLCYVMMTRSVDRLYIGNFTKKDDKNKFSVLFNQAIFSMNLAEINAELISETQTSLAFTIGERHSNIKETKQQHEGAFHPINIREHLWFPDISLQDQALKEDNTLSDFQRFGNQLHALLALVESETSIDELIAESLLNGTIEAQFSERLSADLFNIIHFQPYQELLKDTEKVLNEQGIIIDVNEMKRPDKMLLKKHETIIIDYKTGLPQAKYAKQVQNYVQVLRAMNFPDVKGYVFYTQELNLLQVG